MTRKDFQALAAVRLREARALLAAGHREGAYYLAGYVVEFALKACIAKRTRRHEFPDRDRVKDSYTHDFKSLIGLAGLSEELAKEIRSNREFQANWTLVLGSTLNLLGRDFDGAVVRLDCVSLSL